MGTLEGWLQKKQNRFMGMWQKRWFVMVSAHRLWRLIRLSRSLNSPCLSCVLG
jgi:hypothetical protein